MVLETRYQVRWPDRSVGEPEPASETIYSVIRSHLEGTGRKVFTTSELQGEMRQPYSFEQLHRSLELGDDVELLEQDMNLWLYADEL